ncbi:unnamed protein product [Staurois parvus]|uniref:Uncharacterized protein n=1 Tax=Staurois parvus TaxID=386267 RepID=A0ABN9EMD7_9NEOB|nr:unnamed protein product [Staurois parvus]
MTRDCGHSTGDDQRLWTQYRRWPEIADTVQEMPETADSTGNDQRLQTHYRR